MLSVKQEDNYNLGTIYLVQPCELVGTNRYKIGCSKNTNLERVKKGYKKGTRYICISECINPFILESKIKKAFDNKYKLIAGNEYYEGEENCMYKLFIDIISTHKLEIHVVDTKKVNTNCDACGGSRRSYWSDGIYGKCMDCCDF